MAVMTDWPFLGLSRLDGGGFVEVLYFGVGKCAVEENGYGEDVESAMGCRISRHRSGVDSDQILG